MWIPVQAPAGVADVHCSEGCVGVGCACPVLGALPVVVGVACSLASVLTGLGRLPEHDPGWGVLSGEKTLWVDVPALDPWGDPVAYSHDLRLRWCPSRTVRSARRLLSERPSI